MDMTVEIWCKNSAWRVMPDARCGEADAAVLQLHGARGGRVCGQVLLRDVQDICVESIETVAPGALPAQLQLYWQEADTYADGASYPDRLAPVAGPRVIPAHRTQGLWLVADVAADAAPGGYGLQVVVHTPQGDVRAAVWLRVYNVTVPAPADGVFDHEYFLNLTDTAPAGGPWPLGSEEWWHFAHSCAVQLRALRINTLSVSPVPLLAGASRRTDETHWQFDFTLFDEFVQRMFAWGSFRRIAIGAMLRSLTGAQVRALDEQGVPQWLDTRSAQGEAFVACWLQALQAHLAERGWLGMTVMHIEDEPHESENWLWYRAQVRRWMPDTPCSEPLDEYDSALALKDSCNEFIPRLEVFEQGRDYFARRQAAGDRVWCYSCCFPEKPWYLNRFIDRPAMQARLLAWACYAQGITGFLHWGFCHWAGDLYGLSPQARFKGDGFIVYPDGQGGVAPSLRLLGAAEGVEEYELLCLAARAWPQAAQALALGMARSFRDFCADPAALEAAHIRLLTLCEAAAAL